MTRGFTSNYESPRKRFQAFEFNADDEVVEKVSAKMISKFRNLRKPKINNSTKKKYLDSPITKYNFLQCFTKNLRKAFSNEPIDVDDGAAQGTKTPQKKISTLVLDDDASGSGRQCGSSESFCTGTLAENGDAREMSALDASCFSSSSNRQNKQACTISDEDGRIEVRSSSTLPFSLSKNEVLASLEEQGSDPSSGGYENVETAIGNLHLESKDSRAAGNANKTAEQEAINSLELRYGDIWNLDFDFSKPFEDVIYPQGDPDAVCISKRDLELLQPETFINDTIVDFYIQYLKSKIQPEEKHRFHFFNSFFFRKLADLGKDQLSSFEGKAALQRVLKWTRKVNVFEKDYVFIPVNYRLHWSLIVICHPGEAANVEDEEIESSLKVPCILHMDSIKGSHRGLKNLVQRYLWEEWKEKHVETAEDNSLKFLHLRFVSLELPQQENLFDCGLFLLHYVERFLVEAPAEFSPFKITKHSNFLNKNWFPPADASVKRFLIKKLICKIFEDHSREALIADCMNKHPSPQSPIETHNQTGVKVHEGMSRSTKNFHGSSCGSSARGIRTFLVASPPIQISARSLSLMSPVKEVEDIGNQIDSPVNMEDCHEGTGLASELLQKSCFGNRFRISETPWINGSSKNIGYNVDGNSISLTSSSGSQNSSAAGIDEDCSIMENEAFTHPRKTDKSESSSSEDFRDCVVVDSEEENDMQEDDEVKYISSSLENRPSFHQETDSTKEIDMPLRSEDPVSESADQQARKRLRLTERLI